MALLAAVGAALLLLAVGRSGADMSDANGFPCMTQHTMKLNRQVHGFPTLANSPFEFAVLDAAGKPVKYYQAGEMYTVRLLGYVHYRGLLIQARMADQHGFVIGHHRVGMFVEDDLWPFYGVRFQECCCEANSSITHSNDKKKFLTKARWFAERNMGPVQFVLTLLQEDDVYWERLKPKKGFLLPYDSFNRSTAAFTTPSLELVTLTADVVELAGEDGADEVEQVLDLMEMDEGLMESIGMNETVGAENETRSGVPVLNEEDIIADMTPADGKTTHTPATDAQTPTKVADQFAIESESVVQVRDKDLPLPRQAAMVNVQSTEKIITDKLPTETTSTSTTTRLTTTTTTLATTTTPRPTTTTTRRTTTTTRAPTTRNNLTPWHPLPSRGVPTGACVSNPCQNNGFCEEYELEDDRGIDIICLCQAGFTGRRCQDIDFCLSHECVQGACKNGITGYTCSCYRDFAGTYCDRECPLNLCQQGGTCTVLQNGQFGCLCRSGTTGEQCETEVNECDSNPCENGATCLDLWDDYHCTCEAGFMSKNCDRPCQDIYKSCATWEQQNQCVQMRRQTDFFDENCADSCLMCIYKNETILTDTPLAPILLPYSWLLGRWHLESPSFIHFPLDFFEKDVYDEVLEFSIPNVVMFGTPSLNFTSIAKSRQYRDDVQVSHGYLTIKEAPEGRQEAALLTVSNTGVTYVEEGPVGDQRIKLKPTHASAFPVMRLRLPKESEREYSLEGPHLREVIKKVETDGTLRTVSKYFTRTKHFFYL